VEQGFQPCVESKPSVLEPLLHPAGAEWNYFGMSLKILSMPRKKHPALRCPTCRTLVLPGEENFPFCSDRCRLIDLGKWASGGYVISTPITDPEQLENLAEEQAQKKPEDDQGNKH
jgi:endogenous inhibitor of DNA gyrase (YacG/DUF329 family)